MKTYQSYKLKLYQPAEDSFLLSDCLEKEIKKLINKNIYLEKIKFLDMGAGIGILAKKPLI